MSETVLGGMGRATLRVPPSNEKSFAGATGDSMGLTNTGDTERIDLTYFDPISGLDQTCMSAGKGEALSGLCPTQMLARKVTLFVSGKAWVAVQSGAP
jgi:hypothetical protein